MSFSKLTVIMCLLTPIASYAGWDEQLSKHNLNKDHCIIFAQYQAYKNNTLPKIADDKIKQIPIKESGEPLINISDKNNPRIQMMPNTSQPFSSPDYNSGLPSAPFVRQSAYSKLEKLIVELDLTASKFGYAPGQISIKVFEGLRDINTQDKLFNDKAKELKTLHPNFTQEQIIAETSKWVSPTKNNIPAHSTGGAIDLRLYDKTKSQYLDMGKFGVIWGQNNTAPTFSSELTEQQIINRLFLLNAAENVGLVNYPFEYWHFSTGDRYAVYWQQPKQRQADYNSIKTIY